jgi:hypothetical protein
MRPSRSYTVTETPACASVMAAAKPFGPEPMIRAVFIFGFFVRLR